LQLLAKDWKILPNTGKACLVHGWNSPDFPSTVDEAAVRKWARIRDAKTTGLRIEGGLCAIDVDVDDALAHALQERIAAIAPHVAAAPMRYGHSDFKFALFCRLKDGEEPFGRWASPRYQSDHIVEVFGGRPGSDGRCLRQFAIYGPHPDGGEYAWADGPELKNCCLADLPELDRYTIGLILDAFKTLAREAGWAEVEAERLSHGDVAFDLTDATRFDILGGGTVGYDELEDGMRCSSSFFDPHSGGNRSKCWVSRSPQYEDSVCVYDHKTLTTHYHERFKPVDAAAVGTAIGEIADELGVSMPIEAPNWRERYVTGYPKASLHNARLAIEAIGVHCSLDTFHSRMLMGRSAAASPRERLLPFFGLVTDGTIAALRVWLSNSFGLDFTEKHVRDAVFTLCHENAFDPVVDMLDEAQANWDGVARIDRMAVDYFNAENTELARTFVRLTMIAAVRRARSPGCKFDTILTMESPEGLNKSSAWAVLAGEGNFSDVPILGRGAREVMEHLADIWIHENSELVGIGKAETEAVKAFASRQVDRARPAYGRFLVDQPRHSIEVATTNAAEYLLSMTGNRRFWPVKILGPIDLAKLRAARLQLWGEAAACEARGDSITLDPALWGLAAAEQEARRVEHPWEAKLVQMLPVSRAGPLGGAGYYENFVIEVAGEEQRVATWAIFEHVLKVPSGQMHNGHAKTLAQVMRKLDWEPGVFGLNGKTTRGYKRT
jgi:hypothetical protein